MKIAGWMPLKAHSTRLPGKNWRDFGGKPLYQHMLGTLRLVCPLVFVNSDRDDLGLALRGMADVEVIVRQAQHRVATQSTVEMLVHDLDMMGADVVVYTHATLPLVRPETLIDALECFLANYPRYDSVISVTALQERFYDPLGRAVNFHPGILLPLQEMPPLYLENSAFFIMAADDIRKLHRRVGDRPYLYPIAKVEAVEIDDEDDWAYAEWLYARRQGQPVPPALEDADEAYTARIINEHDLVMNAGRMV